MYVYEAAQTGGKILRSSLVSGFKFLDLLTSARDAVFGPVLWICYEHWWLLTLSAMFFYRYRYSIFSSVMDFISLAEVVKLGVL